MSEMIDLGHGHHIRFAVDRQSGQRFFVDEHPSARQDGVPCAGSGRIITPGVARQDGKAYWTMESETPLTLSPSLLCTACGDHGWVRAGRWEPA